MQYFIHVLSLLFFIPVQKVHGRCTEGCGRLWKVAEACGSLWKVGGCELRVPKMQGEFEFTGIPVAPFRFRLRPSDSQKKMSPRGE
jgi:hypothetical protein